MFNLLLLSRPLSSCIRVSVLSLCVALLSAVLMAAPLHAQPAARLKAPDFDGAVGPTLGSDKALRLKDLRGKIVILEFWTLC